jgi:hypothetical protein
MLAAACGGGPPLEGPVEAPGGGSVIRVPEDQPSIQAGVDAAGDGDLVLVAPGFYFEKVELEARRITVASWYLVSRDVDHRAATVISGRGAAFEVVAPPGEDVDPGEVRIVGFTIRNAKFGVVARDAPVRVEENRIYSNADHAIVAFNAPLVVTGNSIRDHRDGVGIVLNGSSTLVAEDNRFDRNRTAVFAALPGHEGPPLDIVVRGNRITRHTEGGVTLVVYFPDTGRRIRVERNVFDRNLGVALGCRDRRASYAPTDGVEFLDPVFVVHNTFVRNEFGVVGGNNVVLLNNLFVETTAVAVQRLRERSVMQRNGFWRNGEDSFDVPRSRRLRAANPKLDRDFRLESGSPAIDAGLGSFVHDGVTVLPLGEVSGEAPDLGAFER